MTGNGEIAPPPVSEVLATLESDGIYVLDDILPAADIAAIREDTEWFLSAPRPWYRLDQQGSETYAAVAPREAPRSEKQRLRNIAALFSQGFYENVCKGYLGNDAIVDRIIFSRSPASERAITMWHADQQSEGRLSFKFMLYLTDAGEDTGAFSYVRGSHTVMRAVMETAAEQGVPNTDLHSFEEIAAMFERFGSEDEKAWLADVGGHIDGDFTSDDQYSITAKAGSILLFDTKGIHRGGVVRLGERMLVRIHCFEPERRSSWIRRLRTALKPNPFGWG